MLKNILKYAVTFSILFFLGLYTHEYFLKKYTLVLPYDLKNVYLFNAFFSFFVCSTFYIIALKDKIFQQLGFIYLGVLVFKILCFCIIFFNSIISINLSKKESLCVLIPIALFLITEVYFLTKILNKNLS